MASTNVGRITTRRDPTKEITVTGVTNTAPTRSVLCPPTATDALFQGATSTTKPPNTIRISCHNYCGINLQNFSMCLNDIQSLDIDFQGIAETNLNTNQFPVRFNINALFGPLVI